LRESGWSTAAVVSNFVLQRNAGLARGFDRYDDQLPQRELGRDWPERIAADTTDAALELLDSLLIDSPPACFLWIHYQDPHGPYTPPEGYRSRTLETERRAADGRRRLPIEAGRAGQGSLPRYQEIGDEREVAFYRAGYNGEVAYLDEQIGRLIRGLRERGLDEAALVFTSDHGEALGEDDYWFAHGDRLTDPLVHVPLMIHAPDVGPGQRDDVASLVDLFPTLLAMAAESPHASTGRDLLRTDGAANSEPYLATLGAGGTQRYGIVSGSHKLILTRVDDHWDPRLYQHDPLGGERPQRAPETAQRLVGRLMKFREQLPRGKPELRQKLSDEDAERLRALGYGVSDPDRE
jgi:arylsulfatase A-like enzyme